MSNVWTKFKSLIPSRKYLIGTVTSIDSTNKISTVNLLDGSSTNVKGTSVGVGNLCLIENGIIVEELPSLTAHSVTVY